MFDFTKKEAKIIKTNKKIVDSLLEINLNNRNPKKGHLLWLSNAIADNNFILTPQGIGISKNGELIDGQHRLMAIRDAGYPEVEILVVTGLDPKARIYIDQHAKRSSTDMLKIVLDQNINHRMASLVNTHLKISEDDTGFSFKKSAFQKPSLDKIVEVMEKYLYQFQLIISAAGKLPRAGVLVGYFHYALKYDIDAALELSQQVNDGEKLVREDPAYRLRAFLLGGTKRTCYGSAGQLEDYKNTVTACIAHANGEKLAALRPSNSWEGLPKKTRLSVVKAKA